MKKLILFISFLFTLINSVNAQTWQWAKNGIGDSDNEWGNGGACLDKDGNIYVTSAFFSPTIIFDSDTLNNQGNNYQNTFLTKYDPNGNVLWTKGAGGYGDNFGCSISSDASGNVYVTGYYSLSVIFDTYTLTNPSGNSAFLVKYDASGNVLWAKNAVSSIYGYGYSVSVDASGNAFITGFFGGSAISFGTYTLTNTGTFNVFVAKYDTNGNVLWAKSSVGSGDDRGASISTDAAGNAYATGSFKSPNISFGSYTLTNSGNQNVYVTKYDPAGNVLWARLSVGSGTFVPSNSICNDNTGNAYVTGSFDGPSITFGSYTLTNTSGSDIFLVKYDPSGNVSWAKSSSGGGIFVSSSVCADANRIYVSGGFNTTITFGSYNLSTSPGWSGPMFIVKYDFNGNVTYATSLPIGGDDSKSQLCVDKFCNLYVASSFEPYLSSPTFMVGTNSLTCSSTSNIFLAKLVTPQPTVTASSSNSIICASQPVTLSASGANAYSWQPSGSGANIIVTPTITSTYTVIGTSSLTGCSNSAIITQSVSICSGINELKNDQESLMIYPNPNHSSFRLQINFEIDNGEIIIVNSLGQEVYKQTINSGLNEINMHKISNGMYYYSILQNKNNLRAGKILIE